MRSLTDLRLHPLTAGVHETLPFRLSNLKTTEQELFGVERIFVVVRTSRHGSRLCITTKVIFVRVRVSKDSLRKRCIPPLIIYNCHGKRAAFYRNMETEDCKSLRPIFMSPKSASYLDESSKDEFFPATSWWTRKRDKSDSW
jgi:hypothetical protein